MRKRWSRESPGAATCPQCSSSGPGLEAPKGQRGPAHMGQDGAGPPPFSQPRQRYSCTRGRGMGTCKSFLNGTNHTRNPRISPPPPQRQVTP